MPLSRGDELILRDGRAEDLPLAGGNERAVDREAIDVYGGPVNVDYEARFYFVRRQ